MTLQFTGLYVGQDYDYTILTQYCTITMRANDDEGYIVVSADEQYIDKFCGGIEAQTWAYFHTWEYDDPYSLQDDITAWVLFVIDQYKEAYALDYQDIYGALP